MSAAAYVRRSHAGEADVSRKVQESTVARLAEQHGHTIGHTYTDWGRSGLAPDGVGDTLEEILAHRRQALAMMQAVCRGEVDAIYAYRQDRLARDSFTVHLMVRIAKRAGIPIITPRGDITAREQRLLTAVEGGMDEEEGSRAKDRSSAAMVTMVARGDTFGVAPFGYRKARNGDGAMENVSDATEDIGHVLDAYRREGSYLAAARALNAEGFPSKRGGTWYPVTIRGIVLREKPELAAEVTQRQLRARRPRLLAGLMRCHCGGPMSPGTAHGLLYYCGRGQRGAHGKPWRIAESRLLPWIMDEADRLRPSLDVAELDAGDDGYDDGADRAALQAMRERIGETAYLAGIEALDAAREAHSGRRTILEAIPERIEWGTDPVDEINAVLRSMWRHVQLGADLLPVSADWVVPQWRR